MSAKFCFVGDIAPGNKIARINMLDFFEYDLIVANLEVPVLKNENICSKSPKAGPHLFTSKMIQGVEGTTDSSKWIFNLANNHIMDYGYCGLKETLDEIKNFGGSFVGAGENIDQARKPLFRKVGSELFAFIACSDRGFGEARMNNSGFAVVGNWVEKEIYFCSKQGAKVVVLYNGGTEDHHLPSPKIVEMFRNWVSIGASVIVGTHPHVIQPIEFSENHVIAYGLGNFAVDPELWDEDKESNLVSSAVGVDFDSNTIKIQTKNFKSFCDSGDSILVHQVPLSLELENKVNLSNFAIQNRHLHERVWNLLAKEANEEYLKKFLRHSIITFYLQKIFNRLNFSIKKIQNFPLIFNLLAWSENRELLLRNIEIEYKLLKHDGEDLEALQLWKKIRD